MKHLKIFEEFNNNETSPINIMVDGKDLTFTIINDDNKIYLMKDDSIYQELSVDIPDSDDLEDDEFFMAPDIKKEIVDELVSQGFLQKLDKESVAGDKKVIAYKL